MIYFTYFLFDLYSTVFLCRRIADRKLIIIKQIPVEQMTKAERQAALNEVKVLSMLDHPNIIEYYENFLEDKALMIVMEYAQGKQMKKEHSGTLLTNWGQGKMATNLQTKDFQNDRCIFLNENFWISNNKIS